MSKTILPAFGVGLPNRSTPDSAYSKLSIAGWDSTKWIASNFPASTFGAAMLRSDVRRSRAVNPFLIGYARLPDSFVGKERVKGVDEYVSECAWYIDAFLDAGVNSFQVGNEDNNPDCAWLGGGFANPAADNQHFYLAVFSKLRQRFGSAARLGAAPLMHAPGRSTYVEWYNGRLDLYKASDFVCANCYFHAIDQISHPDLGASWLWPAQRCNKPVG
jgi:hypothetical protein